ncbi:lymphoid-specific helicase-like [Rhopalosiphum maidis]|uniref:lymphoid-specific helicase-like n=1 Tax=Rhopalosiphum maidis TaxID=43146 RepID=UPI000F007DDC|nr:lymphoid-specific helicase-like [Rhopalosiphum maidis]XP_026818888.1 lymphoid-specific helicase-like [Rhopalosiphum maidis]
MDDTKTEMDSSDEIDILMEEESPIDEDNSIQEDANSSLNDMDDEEKMRRYTNLLALLENSTKLSNAFETRLKNCKLQIIKSELEKANKVDKDVPSNIENNLIKDSNNQPIENEEYENYYLKLFQQPKLFKGTLKSYQKEGLLWIRTLFENGLNGILADDMGLGKTIQAIAFYCFLIEMGIKGPFLVIAPLSTIPNWLSEFSKFSPQLNTLLYHGSFIQRYMIQSSFKSKHKVGNFEYFPIVITTYEILRMDTKYLKSYDWKYITIDEGHKLKNSLTVTTRCLREFACTNKLILTGTPIQNNMNELWTLLNVLMPKLFNDIKDFSSWFVIDDFHGTNDRIINIATKNEILDTIVKILKPFILRRQKMETDLNLPPKKEIVIYAPVTEQQHKLYMATLSREMDTLLNRKSASQSEPEVRSKRKCVESIERYTENRVIRKPVPEQKVEPKDKAVSLVLLNPFIQLKKISNHPYLVHMPLIPGQNEILVDENIVKASGKFLILDAMLSKLKLLGHKVLLFSTMTQLLDLIEEFLIFRSYEYTRLDGTMKIKDRVEAINTFTDDPNCLLMLISTRAGGLGLNLTAADTVIIFDSDWNPQCDLQAQDRCHRIGQVKPVVVYRFCTKSTVDEKILAHTVAKRKLEKIVIGNGTFNRNTKIDLSNIKELMNLLESSDYDQQIQSNGFILSDEELDSLLDRSDMIKSTPKTDTTQSTKHFEVLT